MKRALKVLVCTLVIALSSCSTKKEDEKTSGENDQKVDNAEKEEQKTAICLWEKISIRDAASSKGKYLTNVFLGEEIYLLGEEKVDESDNKKRSYSKVKLQDNTEGWIQDTFMAKNAYGAAVIEESTIHKRPDLLTATGRQFSWGNFVAVLDESKEWIKVKGKPLGGTWFEEGWIEKKNISTFKPDIAYAAMWQRAMTEKDDKKREEEIQKLKQNPALRESIFFSDQKAEKVTKQETSINDLYECWFQQKESDLIDESNPKGYLSIADKKFHMFQEGTNGILDYYGQQGLLYCITKGSNSRYEGSYSMIEAIKNYTGIDALQNKYDPSDAGLKFKYINPEVVKWGYNNMIPDPESYIFGVKCKTIYNKMFKRFARLMVQSYSYLTVQKNIENEAEEYKNKMESEPYFDAISYLNTKYGPGRPFDESVSTYDEYYGMTSQVAIGFWLRRYIDGSFDQLYVGLNKLMRKYDQEWYEKYDQG